MSANLKKSDAAWNRLRANSKGRKFPNRTAASRSVSKVKR